MEALRTRIAVGLATAASFGGGAEAVNPNTAEAAYQPVGPALQGNMNQVNEQFDFVLEKAGPNSPLAVSIGNRLGIKTPEGRAKYITPENIDLRNKRVVTNEQYPGNTAVAGGQPIPVRNSHDRSEAFTVAADVLPAQSLSKTTPVAKPASEIRSESSSSSSSSSEAVSKKEFAIKKSVLRKLCENMLDQPNKGKAPKRGRVGQAVNMDVSFGLKNDLLALAKSESTSNSSAELKCPDGTRLAATSGARAAAIAQAALKVRESGEFSVKGKNMSAVAFRLKYNQLLSAKVAAATSASSYSSVTGECAPPPPLTVTPTPTPGPEAETNLPPTGEMKVPEHLYVNGLGKLCVENISDRDGDQVIVRNFFMKDANGHAVGQATGPVYSESATTKCVPVRAPGNAGPVTAGAELLDGVAIVDGKRVTDDKTDIVVQDNFPTFPDDFGDDRNRKQRAN